MFHAIMPSWTGRPDASFGIQILDDHLVNSAFGKQSGHFCTAELSSFGSVASGSLSSDGHLLYRNRFSSLNLHTRAY